jgi:hypothetical protein
MTAERTSYKIYYVNFTFPEQIKCDFPFILIAPSQSILDASQQLPRVLCGDPGRRLEVKAIPVSTGDFALGFAVDLARGSGYVLPTLKITP